MRKVFWKILFCAVLIVATSSFFTTMNEAHATTRAKVVLEFDDGSKIAWKTGDEKVDVNGKKIKYIYFGNYPQTEISGKKLTKKIKNAKYDKNGIVSLGNVKYCRISMNDAQFSFLGANQLSNYFYDWTNKEYAYFKYEPIKWRVLSSSKKKILVVSEYGIDDKRNAAGTTWKNSDLRRWLNNHFLSSTFNSAEKKMIKKTRIYNKDNPYYGTKGGESTKDKIFLLSYEDVTSKKYGFSSEGRSFDKKRICLLTDYARAKGCVSLGESKRNCIWWLRSPAYFQEDLIPVYDDGYVVDDGVGEFIDNRTGAIRPALYLDLSLIIN